MLFDFETVSRKKYCYALGRTVSGEMVSIFDFTCHRTQSIWKNKKVIIAEFTFRHFAKGDCQFHGKNKLKLRQVSFRINNLEQWSDDHILPNLLPRTSRGKIKLGSINIPSPLRLFEDEYVTIQIETGYNLSRSNLISEISLSQHVIIKAKHNRKLPYWSEKNEKSFSKYLTITYGFFQLVIGKKAIIFDITGIVNVSSINLLLDQKQNDCPPKKHYVYEEVKIFNNRSINKRILQKIDIYEMILPRKYIKDREQVIFSKFFAEYKNFGFVLDDWCGMRNRFSLTNHSLPELLYNFEGLHRSFFPEKDSETSEYKKRITSIIKHVPDSEKEFIQERLGYHFTLRKRLKDVFVSQQAIFFPYLTSNNKNKIIDDLNKIRNNAAHSKNEERYNFDYLFSLLQLLELQMAILILRKSDTSDEVIVTALNNNFEWHDLKQRLIKYLN